MVISFTTTAVRRLLNSDMIMRALSFILAFAFVLAGSSLAGLPDGSLPGVGTFQYSGSPAGSAPHPIVVAARL